MTTAESIASAQPAAAAGPAARPDCARVAELFVRGVGAVFALAFASLWVQVIGLLGARGITPAAELLALASERLGGAAWLRLPTWLWLSGASDVALHGLCALGLGCALAAAAGRLRRTALLGAWSCYLSLCSVGDVFLSYQWDALLLESGLVAVFAAAPNARLGVWLARALCFKLMFLSGAVKLLSGDPSWRDLSALSYHWWTQPLPGWTSVPASELPSWLQAGATLATLAIETAAPFAILGPRRVRLCGAALLALLQLLIAATGTYGFFNLLALAICASLLDDAALVAICPRALWRALERTPREARPATEPLARLQRAVWIGLAGALLAASALVSLQRLVPLPDAANRRIGVLSALRSVNAYGLFAVMTVERREIAIEGSNDGREWRRYEFRWKPDDVTRRPRFATPHMPRLDWQMWFAALGRCEDQPWLLAFLARLLEGSPDALGLLERNPFPDAPPRLLRTPVARYRFAPAASWLRGTWWVREDAGAYCPTVTLRDGQLAVADRSEH